MRKRLLGALFLLGFPMTAAAFCGFFVSGADAKLVNNASQVVLMRNGNHTVIDASELSTLGADVMQQPMAARYGPQYVLTRLHTRYDKQALSDDLVFRETVPLEGGRQYGNETRTIPGGFNNFQARYIIHHYWSGPVACKDPQWENWGGPPQGHEPKPIAATGLANAARGKIALPTAVRSPLPLLGLPGQKRPGRK